MMLEELKVKFDTWRINKRWRSESIPEDLLKLAIEQTKTHSAIEVSKYLGVEKSKISPVKNKSKKATSKLKKNTLELIEISPSFKVNAQKEVSNKLIAEINYSSGKNIRVFSGVDQNTLKSLLDMA